MDESSRTNIGNIIIGNANAKFQMKSVKEDFILKFIEMTNEEQIAAVKADISTCVKSLGYYAFRTSMKQLAKDFSTSERYNLICKYEDQYNSILKTQLEL